MTLLIFPYLFWWLVIRPFSMAWIIFAVLCLWYVAAQKEGK